MEIELKKMIFEGFYDEAEKILLNVSASEQRGLIMNLAYETESISVYSFLRYMTEKNKNRP